MVLPGGYTTGPAELVQLLRQKSRPYLFSNSCPPPIVASASKVRICLKPLSELCQSSCANRFKIFPKISINRFSIADQFENLTLHNSNPVESSLNPTN